MQNIFSVSPFSVNLSACHKELTGFFFLSPGTTAMVFSSARAHDLLAQHFGYTAFRNGQVEVIQSIVEGNDTLVIMPTGGGKSVCYQIPALLCEGVAIVVSPLIALMKDQVDALARANIRAAFINSTLSFQEIRQRLHDARFGKYKLLYVAPERLESKEFLEALALIPLSFIAVDEAHCVSEWGHDFRPSYMQVATANEVLGRLPVIALTATATPEVQGDIAKHLQMRAPKQFIRGFDRPNLRYLVERNKQKVQRVISIAAEGNGSTIVYCASRKRVEDFTEALRSHRVAAEAYHGGLADTIRKAVQERFIEGRCKTIVATNAFGMGVDKADVRTVIHCDLTLSLEAYYQEAGRAGRDSNPSDCLLLYDPSDRGLQEFFIRTAYPEAQTLESVYTFLYDFHSTPLGVKSYAPILLDDIAIANRVGVHISVVSTAIGLFERAEIIRRGSTQGLASIQITTSRERVQEYYNNTQVPERKNVLIALLRTLGSEALEQPVQFNVHDLLRKHDITQEEFQTSIRAFEYARLVRFEPAGTTGGIQLLLERMPFARLPIRLDALAERRTRAYKKLDTVQRYAETPECKRNFLLHYFQEYDIHTECGQCSSCKEAKTQKEKRSHKRQFLLQQILTTAAELNGRFGKTVLVEVAKGSHSQKIKTFALTKAVSFGSAGEFSKQEIVEEMESAIAERLLTVSSDLYPTINVSERGYRLLQHIPNPIQLLRRQDRPVVSNHPVLFEKCKAIRREIAARESIPEQAVADDVTLLTLVNALPRSQHEVTQIIQTGPIFLSRFAPQFLQAIREYIAAEVEEDVHEKPLPPRIVETVGLARAGHPLETIATKRGLTQGTVSQHVQEAIDMGVALERRQFVPDILYAQVKDFLRLKQQATLREIRSGIDVECEYAQLRLAAAFARQELQKVGRA